MSVLKSPETIKKSDISTLDDFYRYVKKHGLLHTLDHAKRWTAGTLQMLGVNVSSKIKKRLAQALPKELANELKGVFWLAHFRNENIEDREFFTRVARRSRAASDPDLARYPVQAVFGGLKAFLNEELINDLRDDLAPDLSKLWDEA